MSKDEIINKLTLIDTSLHRIRGHHHNGIYPKEVQGFRVKLKEVYEHLSLESLNKLLKLKQ